MNGNYIGVLILGKFGKDKEAAELIDGWEHFQDSLYVWHISDIKNRPEVNWVLAKYYNPEADTKALESQIKGTGKESQFTLLFRALELLERKRRLKY